MIAKNNIFNIRKSSRYQWLGSDGQNKGFVTFMDPQYSIRACCYLLLRSYRIAGCHTIRKIISRFAPSSENDTENYIKFVSKKSGIGEHDTVSTARQYAKIISAIAKMETDTDLSEESVLDVIRMFDLKLYSGRTYAIK